MKADYEEMVHEAVRLFWQTRLAQSRKQGKASGRKDTGARAAVTGGAQMDGFVSFVRNLLIEAGIRESEIFYKRSLELPGYFRAEKKWDIVVVADDLLIAALEMKSQVGSFGNNCNNRSEEAIGSARDYWTAYREKAFGKTVDPWLGYLMLLEDVEGSRRSVSVKEPHFPVFPEFQEASYAKRYELLLLRLVHEKLYNSACLLLSSKSDAKSGEFSQPCDQLAVAPFIASLLGKVRAFTDLYR